MMKGYDSYKESGSNWIGNIPKQWGKAPLKFISDIKKGRKPIQDFEEPDLEMLPYLSMEVLRGQTNSPLYVDVNQESVICVDEGDILILWDGSKAGEIVKAKKGVLSSTMAVLDIPKGAIDKNYLTYYLQFSQTHIQANTVGMGIPHVNGNVLKDLTILFPSTSEQTQIAAFLDHQTGLIDALIAKKEALIEKLKLQRQAIINEAVTKGLDPNAKMKDSGIEWLGEIPEEWGYSKLKWLANIYSGGTPSTAIESYWINGTIPWLNSGSVNQSRIQEPSALITEEALLKSSAKWVPAGSLLMALAGQGKTKGTVAILDFDSTCNQSMAAIVPKETINNEYLFYWLDSNYSRIRGLAGSDQRDGLNLTILGDINCPLPPLPLQNDIANYLSELTFGVQTTCDSINTQIEKLKLYRQSLISEAVTGKIDVREWKPKKLAKIK